MNNYEVFSPMAKEKSNILSKYLQQLLAPIKNLIWLLIILIILATGGRFLALVGDSQSPLAPEREKVIVPTIDWTAVDQDLVTAISQARKDSELYAREQLNQWIDTLMVRVDTDFLDWYFSYWTQQLLGLESLYQYGVNSFFTSQPTAAQKLTEEIQEEFSNRVLRPHIAELVLERIVRETVDIYISTLQTQLAAVPTRYAIPSPDWDRYIEGIALTTSTIDGNRETAITVKGLTLASASTALVLTGKMKVLIGKLSSKLMAKSVSKGAAGVASSIAAKGGAKVAAKSGGKFLGPIVGIGIIIWDVWDHSQTKAENRPILRQSLVDYFAELQDILLHDTESGMMAIFSDFERQIESQLRTAKPTTNPPDIQ